MAFVKKIVRSSAQIFENMSDFDQAAAAEPAEPSNDAASSSASKDKDLEDYLYSWGLGMYLDKFKEQCVDLDTLRILSAEDLKELVPVIGHRAKLANQIAMLKDIVTDAFCGQNTTDDDQTNKIYLLLENEQTEEQGEREREQQTPPSDLIIETNKDCELYKLLSASNEGKGLLLQYQENGLLDSSSRRRLCNIIINNELKDEPDKSITSSRLYHLAYGITQVSRKESASVYFIPFSSFSPQQKVSAKGKLLDCYRQKRRAFLKSGIIKGKEKNANSSPASTSYSNGEVPEPSNSVKDITLQLPEPTDNDEEKVLWLKNCTDPWATVEEYWAVTTKFRLTYLQSNKSIQQYFNDFKALNQPGGIFLLLKDFKSLYPENDQKLFENWPTIRAKIIKLAKVRSIVHLKEVLDDIDNQCNEVMDIAAFMSIPFLMTTSNSINKQLQIAIQHKTASFKGSFKYAAAKIWNNLPPPLREPISLAKFRELVKKHFLELQKLN